MKYTPNYELKKPEQDDFYNVDDFNENADIIDQKLKEIEDKTQNIEVPVTSVNGKTGDVVLTAEDVGAETPAGAQVKANIAEADAKAYTDAHEQKAAPHSGHETPAGAQAKANTAEANAKAYTDQEVSIVANDLVSHKNESASLDNLGHVKHAILTATLNTTWSGSAAPYTKTITVSGILATDTPIIDIVMSGTYATDEARQEAWGYVYRAVTANGSITFYATEKPTVSLPIQIRVVR